VFILPAKPEGERRRLKGQCTAWALWQHRSLKAAATVSRPTPSPPPELANFLTFIDALGRDANFDPQTDPIVRVEAGRRRRALEQYYAGDGRDDPVIIELPLGGYVPEFRANTATHRAVARTQDWPAWTFDGLRENFRLVLLVATVAMVSLSFDLLWMLIG
jgi:hypothetical protein